MRAGYRNPPDRLGGQRFVGSARDSGDTIRSERQPQFQGLFASSGFRNLLPNGLHIAGKAEFTGGILKARHVQIETQNAGERFRAHRFDQLISGFNRHGLRPLWLDSAANRAFRRHSSYSACAVESKTTPPPTLKIARFSSRSEIVRMATLKRIRPPGSIQPSDPQ